MATGEGPSPGGVVDWMEVGPVPATVRSSPTQRIRRVFTLMWAVPPFFVGGLAGFAATLLVPGNYPWPEVFFGVGIPAGLADLIFARWYARFLVGFGYLFPEAIAVTGPNVQLRMPSGRVFAFPLTNLKFTDAEFAEGWQSVDMMGAQSIRHFYAPRRIVQAVRSAAESAFQLKISG
jgi:hypothetical protein